MKLFTFFACAVISVFSLFSCKKDASTPGIVGKWQIVSDSTKITGYDTFPSSHSNYIGQSDDYYDFRNDGNLYVKEGIVLDTMAYEVKANNQIGCTPSPGFSDSYDASSVTAHAATLTVSGNMAQGQLVKIVNLKR